MDPDCQSTNLLDETVHGGTPFMYVCVSLWRSSDKMHVCTEALTFLSVFIGCFAVPCSRAIVHIFIMMPLCIAGPLNDLFLYIYVRTVVPAARRP